MQIAEHAFQPVPGAFRDLRRRDVFRVDPQLQALQAELIEAPVGQERDRAPCDAAAPCGRRDEVADLALSLLEIELDEPRPAEEGVAVVWADRKRGTARVCPAVLVPLAPAASEVLVGVSGNA